MYTTKRFNKRLFINIYDIVNQLYPNKVTYLRRWYQFIHAFVLSFQPNPTDCTFTIYTCICFLKMVLGIGYTCMYQRFGSMYQRFCRVLTFDPLLFETYTMGLVIHSVMVHRWRLYSSFSCYYWRLQPNLGYA